MPLLTIEQARAHCRVDGVDEDAVLIGCIAAAEDAAAAHLNRALFDDDDALSAALDGIPAETRAADQAYAHAVESAAAITDDGERKAALAVAQAKRTVVRVRHQRAMDGLVANASVRAACLLMVGHLYTHREAVAEVTQAAQVELPLGMRDLLRPYRKVMMP